MAWDDHAIDRDLKMLLQTGLKIPICDDIGYGGPG
jgi:hypothetical protein